MWRRLGTHAPEDSSTTCRDDLKIAVEPSSRFTKLREAIGSGQAVFITGTGVSVAACGDQEVDGHKVATCGWGCWSMGRII